MIEISPRPIRGEWTSGYALDLHTVRSEYIGEDEYGRAQFDTERSEMGELLYRLKYRSDRSVLVIIAETVAEFVRSRSWPVDLLIPVPPSRATRSFQPVRAVATRVSKLLELPLCPNCVVKTKETAELKDVFQFDERMKLLGDAYRVVTREVAGCKVLLFDDLYRSGATLTAITRALKRKGRTKSVYALTLTMTRRKR